MGIFNKVFGPSELTQELMKASTLKKAITIDGIDKYVQSSTNEKRTQSLVHSSITFDFINSTILCERKLGQLLGFDLINIIKIIIKSNEIILMLGSSDSPTHYLKVNGSNIIIDNNLNGISVKLKYSSDWIISKRSL